MDLGDVDPDSEELFRDAVRYLQVCLLSDLRPPWAGYNFPQALPGNGMLSTYTRPSYLQWEALDAGLVFGKKVMSKLAKAATAVSVDVTGVLGRPLYVCTAPKAPVSDSAPEWLCLSTATMSPLLQLAAARKHYLCAKCNNDGKAPVSGSAALRVLHLYVTVAAKDGLPTPLRMKAVPVVLEAPPDTFGWNVAPGSASVDYSLAVPSQFQIAESLVAYKYNTDASEAIWSSAQSFRGTP